MIESVIGFLLLPVLAVYIGINIVAEILRASMATLMDLGAWIDSRLSTRWSRRRVRLFPGWLVTTLKRWMGRDRHW